MSDSEDVWTSLISGSTKNTANFKTAQIELVETLIGDEAYDKHIEYLQDTRKSHDKDVHK